MNSPPPPPSPTTPPAAPAGASLRSINCTQCAAPITLHGGHKVLSITCSYCGSELDAKDEYKLIAKFTQRDRPLTPIELGMTGTFMGVRFTVIALVQFRTTDGYGWLEFALFSPTHGYAWLEQTDNHFVFSRRTRDLPSTPMHARVKSTFKVRDRTYQVFERYSASIIYVEGELTYVARAGDQIQVTEGISPPFIYSVERTEHEEEFVLGEYIEPEEVFKALSIQNEPGPRRTVHPAQPYVPSRFTESLSQAATYFLPVSIVLLIAVLMLGWGSTLLAARFDAGIFRAGMQSEAFRVDNPGKLLQIEMHSPLRNAWAAYDIQVRKGEKQIFSMAKQISYYSGTEGGEHWSEGSQKASAYFKVPEAGDYRLVIRGEGGSGRNSGQPPRTDLLVKVNEGIIVSRYFVILVLVCTLGFALRYAARWRFESKRWGDTDDDD